MTQYCFLWSDEQHGQLHQCVQIGVWSQFLPHSNQLRHWWHDFFRLPVIRELVHVCSLRSCYKAVSEALHCSLIFKELSCKSATARNLGVTHLHDAVVYSTTGKDVNLMIGRRIAMSKVILCPLRSTPFLLASKRIYSCGSWDKLMCSLLDARLFCLLSFWMSTGRQSWQSALQSTRIIQ